MADNRGYNCNQQIREAVCIDTKRVFDSCADKDCISDIRVCFTNSAQEVINAATSIRCKGSEVIHCFIDVDEIQFNRGFYSVDIIFFIKVSLDTYTCAITPPVPVEGLVIFSKRCILYGSDGRVKTFSSDFTPDFFEENPFATTQNPIAKVQCVDPICLDAKLCRPSDCCDTHRNFNNISSIPDCVCREFNGSFTQTKCDRAVRVTLGLFSIIQLEREVQLMIPTYDYCIPSKECNCESQDPCDAFKKIKFPLDEFFPSVASDEDDNNDDRSGFIGCNCGG